MRHARLIGSSCLVAFACATVSVTLPGCDSGSSTATTPNGVKNAPLPPPGQSTKDYNDSKKKR